MNADKKQHIPGRDLSQLSRRSYYLLALVALLMPYALLLLRLDLSPLPDVDYWFMALQIWNPDGTLNFPGLFEVWNQHFMVLGKGLFVLNTYLTGGSNYGLVGFAVGLSFLCSLIMSVYFAKAVPPGFDLVRISTIFAIAAAMTPVIGSHLFQMGMSGTQWFLANLLAILALASQNHAWSREGRSVLLWNALAGFVALVACTTYGTGYAVLPALLLLALLARRPKKELLVLLPWLIPIFVLFLYAQARPLIEEGIVRDFVQEEDQWPAMARLLFIPASMMGGLFTGNFTGAVAGGLLSFGVFAVLLYFLIRNHAQVNRFIYLFLGISLYGGGAVLIISLGRFNRAIDFAMSQSRYYSLPALFLVGLVMCVILLFLHYRERLPFKRVGLVCLVLPIALAAGILNRESPSWTWQTLKKERGAIALRLGEVPSGLGIFPRKGEGFEPLFEALSHLGHYPFNDDHPLHARLGQKMPEPKGVLPLVDLSLEAISANSLRVDGIMRQPKGEKLDFVFLTDQHGVVIGAAQPGFEAITDPRDLPGNAAVFEGVIRVEPGKLEAVLVYGVLRGRDGVFRIAQASDPLEPKPRVAGE